MSEDDSREQGREPVVGSVDVEHHGGVIFPESIGAFTYTKGFLNRRMRGLPVGGRAILDNVREVLEVTDHYWADEMFSPPSEDREHPDPVEWTPAAAHEADSEEVGSEPVGPTEKARCLTTLRPTGEPVGDRQLSGSVRHGHPDESSLHETDGYHEHPSAEMVSTPEPGSNVVYVVQSFGDSTMAPVWARFEEPDPPAGPELYQDSQHDPVSKGTLRRVTTPEERAVTGTQARSMLSITQGERGSNTTTPLTLGAEQAAPDGTFETTEQGEIAAMPSLPAWWDEIGRCPACARAVVRDLEHGRAVCVGCRRWAPIHEFVAYTEATD